MEYICKCHHMVPPCETGTLNSKSERSWRARRLCADLSSVCCQVAIICLCYPSLRPRYLQVGLPVQRAWRTCKISCPTANKNPYCHLWHAREYCRSALCISAGLHMPFCCTVTLENHSYPCSVNFCFFFFQVSTCCRNEQEDKEILGLLYGTLYYVEIWVWRLGFLTHLAFLARRFPWLCIGQVHGKKHGRIWENMDPPRLLKSLSRYKEAR